MSRSRFAAIATVASLAAGLLSSASGAIAEDTQYHVMFRGPYIGAQIGGGLERASFDFSNGELNTESQIAPEARLFLGYGYEYQTAYAGLEVSAGYSRPRLHSGEAELAGGFDPAVDLRLGLTPLRAALLYAKLGLSVRDQHLHTASGEDDGFTPGLRVGFGADYLVMPSVFLRAEFTSTFYRSLDATTSTGQVEGSLSNHQIGIGVGYRF